MIIEWSSTKIVFFMSLGIPRWLLVRNLVYVELDIAKIYTWNSKIATTKDNTGTGTMTNMLKDILWISHDKKKLFIQCSCTNFVIFLLIRVKRWSPLRNMVKHWIACEMALKIFLGKAWIIQPWQLLYYMLLQRNGPEHENVTQI